MQSSKVVVFGVGQNSQVVTYYLKEDSDHEILAFCVDDEYLETSGKTLMDLPVMSLTEVRKNLPPAEVKMLAPLYGSKMGDNRKKVYYRIKEIGYDFISYISTRANIYTDRIGDNVIILEGNTLQPFVQIGSNVSIWSNNHLGHHSTIESHATITSHVVISGNCKIGENCFLGVNSSIADHVRLGNYTFVGAGTTVTKNTTEGSVLATSQSEARKIDSRRLRY